MRVEIPTIRRGNSAYAVPSLSHTVGNVTFKFTKMLKEMFGKGFYKYVHIDSRMAYTEFMRHDDKEFIHKNKPILAIKPTYDILNEDIFLTHSLLTTNMYGFNYGMGQNIMPLFRDPEIGNSLGYMLDRIRVSLGVTILLDTYQEQMNVLGTFNAMYNTEQPYYNRTAIEIHIPHQFMEMISLDKGIPIYDQNGSVEKFLRYLNMNSSKPITFQMKNSNGHEEFFMYYPLNIEYMFTDLDRGDPEKKGSAYTNAPISFILTTEFNYAQLFAYNTPPNSSSIQETITGDIVVPDFKGQELIVPMFTYENMFEPLDSNGWKYFTSRMYKVDETGVPDILDISSIFESTNIHDVIGYQNTLGLDNHMVLSVRVQMAGEELKEGKDFEFDYENLVIKTLKTNDKVTYRFTIYVNNEYINDTMVKLHPEEFIHN